MVDNTVTIIGNLTADPEVRVTDSGATLAEIRMAQNKRKRNSDGSWDEGEPMFFQGTVWNDMAENAASTLQKGMRVIVVGRLNYRSWETQDGQNRSVVDIAIDEIAPSLRWAKANVERTSGGGNVSETPKVRDNFEENEAPFWGLIMGKSNNRSSKPRLSKYEAPKQRRISKEQIQNATYKDVKLLEKFLSDRGKIRSSLITGITKQEQAKIARLVKIGRELALLPYVTTSSYKQSYNRRWKLF